MNRPDESSPGGPSTQPEPHRKPADLLQTEERLAFALEAGRMGSWDLDIAAGRFTTTDYCRVVFGLGPDDPFERYEDVVALVHPDDRERRQRAVDLAISGGGDLEVEYRSLRPDGSFGWVMARGRAMFENGRAVRIAGISMDITERKAAEDRQALLMHELNHRVKNTLATVQSLALQSLGFGEDAPAGADSFLDRLHALARVHDLLSEAAWLGASLGDVVRRTLAPYVEGADRFTISGPPVRLAPNAAVTLNMAFHELATNAVKYGAMSTPTGAVDIAWREEGGAVTLDWRETGGPPTAPPTHSGFGSRLIRQGLARELGCEAQLTFLPQGLWCHLRIPLSDKLSLAR
jgi:two-component sensor histidine kinase